MTWTEIFIIAIGLSMDSFAVSVCNGFSIKSIRFKDALLIAVFLSAFQGIMPVLGWLSGTGMKVYITATDHWIAFIILTFLGARMIYDGFSRKVKKERALSLTVLVGMSVATSIDALAVGVSFAFMDISIISPALVIGGVTFLFSMTGLFLGKKFGSRISNKAEIAGGVILIGIGTKILIEHTLL